MAVVCAYNNQILMIGLYGREEDKDELIALLDAISHRFVSELASQHFQVLTSRQEQKIGESTKLQEIIDLGTARAEELPVLRQQRRKLIADSEADEINKHAVNRVLLIEPAASSSK